MVTRGRVTRVLTVGSSRYVRVEPIHDIVTAIRDTGVSFNYTLNSIVSARNTGRVHRRTVRTQRHERVLFRSDRFNPFHSLMFHVSSIDSRFLDRFVKRIENGVLDGTFHRDSAECVVYISFLSSSETVAQCRGTLDVRAVRVKVLRNDPKQVHRTRKRDSRHIDHRPLKNLRVYRERRGL